VAKYKKKPKDRQKNTPIKFNHLNFLYFINVSFLVLLAVFLANFVGFFQTKYIYFPKKPYVLLQTEGLTYTLESTEADIQIYEDQESQVDVLLKDDEGNLVLDQSDVYYTWELDNPSVIEIDDYGYDADCPYDIVSPCPNFHADVQPKKAGTVAITVKALVMPSDQEIASTTINVEVFSIQFTTTYQIKFKGVNVMPANTLAQTVLISGYNDSLEPGCQEFSFENPASVLDNGVYQGSLSLDSCFQGSGYRLCIKGPRHLQKCFDNITLEQTVLDLTSFALIPGDLPIPQDGHVDNQDFNFLWENKGNAESGKVAVGDLNLDGVLNMGDISLLLQALNTADE
jgi:hypothetical protein